jgi:phage shock protein PspC (stress-responsive transcriptional regulator)
MKKLYLSDTNRKIGGVCGGIAEYFDKDPTIIRIAFVLVAILTHGLGIIAYFVMWLVIPKKPKAKSK